jgi:hypothetical protein
METSSSCMLLFRSIVALNPQLPSWKMLVFLFLPATSGTSHRLIPLTNCNSTRCSCAAYVEVGEQLDIVQSERVLSAIFIIIYLHFLIIFVHNPNVLRCVVLGCLLLAHISSSSVCLFPFSVSVRFLPPVLFVIRHFF